MFSTAASKSSASVTMSLSPCGFSRSHAVSNSTYIQLSIRRICLQPNLRVLICLEVCQTRTSATDYIVMSQSWRFSNKSLIRFQSFPRGCIVSFSEVLVAARKLRRFYLRDIKLQKRTMVVCTLSPGASAENPICIGHSFQRSKTGDTVRSAAVWKLWLAGSDIGCLFCGSWLSVIWSACSDIGR